MRQHRDTQLFIICEVLTLNIEFLSFINTVRPKKRYAKWVKKEKDSDLAVVKEYYGYNDIKARQSLTILSDHQINEMKKRIDKGGRNAG